MRFARLMLLACLAVRAAAAENHAEIDAPLLSKTASERARAAAALTEPTRVRLQARMRLSDAIAALCKTGNPTALVKSIDGSRAADIEQDGDSYWSAVAALCKAFALKPAHGAQCPARMARDDLVAIEAGPLLLADASSERGMVLPCGALAMVARDCHIERIHGEGTETRFGLSASMRLEPRVPADTVGWCGLHVSQVSDQHGRVLPIAGDHDQDYSEVAREFELQLQPPEEPSELRLTCQIHLALEVPWRVTTSIAAGDTTSIACGDQTLSLMLVDGEHSAPAGTQGPLIELDYPHAALLGEPQLSVTRAGVDASAHGGGAFDTATGRSIILTLQKIDAAPYQATVVGATALGDPIAIDQKLVVPVSELAEASGLEAPIAMFAPTRISWSAGHVSLRDALAKLGGAGDPVLLQLGTDERLERDVPAFSGSFWDGLLAVCHAYDLQPALESVGSGAVGGEDPASEGTVTIGLGPVSIGAAHGPLCATANGSLLIESSDVTMVDSRSLSGGGRHMTAALRMRLEPRVAEDAIGDCSATIDTFCRDDAGNVLTASDPRPPAAYQRSNRLRWRRSDDSPGPVADPIDFPIRIDGLLPTTHAVTIGGHLRVAVQRKAHREVALDPGNPSNVEVGNEQISITLVDQANAQSMGLPGPGVIVIGTRNLVPGSLRLIGPSGAPLPCVGAAFVPHNRSQLLYRFAVSENGPHVLMIDDVLPAGVVRLPFSHVIAVPGGR